jgi:hypothetical protein
MAERAATFLMQTAALSLMCVLQVSKWQRGPGLVLWTLTPLATCDLQVYTRSLHGGAAGLAEAFAQSHRDIPLVEVLRIAKDVSNISEGICRICAVQQLVWLVVQGM